jgi:hypothetical protein
VSGPGASLSFRAPDARPMGHDATASCTKASFSITVGARVNG